jgi:type I restriction enzyme S subunit
MSRALVESFVDWIGSIPTDWNVQPLGLYLKERKEKVSDVDYKPLSVTKNGVVPQLDTAAKTDAHDDRKKVCKNDFAINSRSDRKQSCGLSYLDGSVSLINIVLQINKYYPEYIKYALDNNMFAEEFYRNGHGIVADLWTTKYSDMKHIRIPEPSYEEQVKISEYLNKMCNKIDKIISDNNKEIELLEEYKRSFQKKIFDDNLKDKNIVQTKIGAMASLVTKQTGFDYSSTIKPSLLPESNDNTFPYLQTRHFKDNDFNYETEFYIPKDVALKFPKILLNKKCILFSIVGASIGNVAVYPGNTTSFLGGAICKVDLYDESLCEYIKCYMLSDYGQEMIKNKINASAQGTITVQNVRDFKIPITDKLCMDKIVSLINNNNVIVNKIIDYRKQIIEKLEEYKKSFIYECVTGKKEV